MQGKIHLHLQADSHDSRLIMRVDFSSSAQEVLKRLNIDSKKVSAKLTDTVREILINKDYTINEGNNNG